MSISSVSPAALGATPPTTTPAASGASVGGLDSNSFLQLLVSQLTHQDPMNPTDATTYITEEAEFSMVQSMNSMATQNATILNSQQMQEATSFIGKGVVYSDANGTPQTGIVTAASPGSNGALVRIGTSQVPLSSIASVFDPSAAASTTPPASSTTTPPPNTTPSSTTPSTTTPSTTTPSSTA